MVHGGVGPLDCYPVAPVNNCHKCGDLQQHKRILIYFRRLGVQNQSARGRSQDIGGTLLPWEAVGENVFPHLSQLLELHSLVLRLQSQRHGTTSGPVSLCFCLLLPRGPVLFCQTSFCCLLLSTLAFRVQLGNPGQSPHLKTP